MHIGDGFPHENEQAGPEPVSPACFRAFVGLPSKAVCGKSVELHFICGTAQVKRPGCPKDSRMNTCEGGRRP